MHPGIQWNGSRPAKNKVSVNIHDCTEDENGIADWQGEGVCIKGTLPMERITQVSLKQKLMSITTDWVTETLFEDSAFMRKYVMQFQCFYKKHVGGYLKTKGICAEKCVLIYKGGNVIVNYIADIAAHSEVFNPLIAKSDVDFLVYAPDKAFFNDHMGEITKLIVKAVYDQLAWLRGQTQMKLLTCKRLQQLLPKYIDEGNTFGMGIAHAVPEARLDTFILSEQSKVLSQVANSTASSASAASASAHQQCASIVIQRDALIKDAATPVNDPMYVTYNDSLRFKMQGVNGDAKFNLVRIKYNVKLLNTQKECTMRVPGEVLDVSISLPDDFKIHATRNMRLNDWTRVRKNDIRVPTIQYLAYHDLHNILFEEQEFPWHDIKYEKRLARLVLLLQLIEVGADKLDDSQLYKYDSTKTKNAKTVELNTATHLILKFSTCKNIDNLLIWISDVQRNNVPEKVTVDGPFGKLREWIAGVKCKVDKNRAEYANFETFLATCVKLLAESTGAVHSYFNQYVEEYHENNTNNAIATLPQSTAAATKSATSRIACRLKKLAVSLPPARVLYPVAKVDIKFPA